MSDLISRSALLRHKTYLWDPVLGHEGCVCVEDIVSAPAVDAVPVDKIHFTDLYLANGEAIATFKFGNQGITLRRDCGELAPVVHGRWETNNDPEEIVKDFSCSVCEELLCDFDAYALTPGENCFYYCPNCGAKMDGEKKENAD